MDISLKEDKKAVKIQIWIENKYGGKYNNRLNAQTQKCYINNRLTYYNNL